MGITLVYNNPGDIAVENLSDPNEGNCLIASWIWQGQSREIEAHVHVYVTEQQLLTPDFSRLMLGEGCSRKNDAAQDVSGNPTSPIISVFKGDYSARLLHGLPSTEEIQQVFLQCPDIL